MKFPIVRNNPSRLRMKYFLIEYIKADFDKVLNYQIHKPTETPRDINELSDNFLNQSKGPTILKAFPGDDYHIVVQIYTILKV